MDVHVDENGYDGAVVGPGFSLTLWTTVCVEVKRSILAKPVMNFKNQGEAAEVGLTLRSELLGRFFLS